MIGFFKTIIARLFYGREETREQFMWLIVGLGNPGAEYQGHRHNVGFMMIDQIAGDYGFSLFKKKFQGLVSQGVIDNQKVLLLKPGTFMNNSGQSVQAAASFYNIPEDKIIVLYDELDLPLTKLRVRQGGGSGGHNGIKSLDKHLPSKDYWRVRIGIDHPGDKNRVSGYVLSNFAKAEAPAVEDILYYGSKHIPLLLKENKSDYMTQFAESMNR